MALHIRLLVTKKSLSKSPKKGKDITFKNPYTNNIETIKVLLTSTDKKFPYSVAAYNPQTNYITVFTHNLDTTGKNREEIFTLYRSYISHEFVHAIDPSIKGDKWRNKERLNIDEKLRFDEFNAYSKQIADYLINIINPQNEEQIKNWMRTQNMRFIPKEIMNYQGLLLKWQKEKPEYIRKFFDKLYSDLFKRE